MKALIATFIFASSSAMAMTNMPDGTYQGEGRWSDNQGETGHYEVSVNIESDTVSSSYSFDSGQTGEYEFQTTGSAHSQFDVLVGGIRVGEGYCMSVQCHYSISLGNKVLEETLTFYEDNLYRIGSKRLDSVVITWEESMTIKGE